MPFVCEQFSLDQIGVFYCKSAVTSCYINLVYFLILLKSHCFPPYRFCVTAYGFVYYCYYSFNKYFKGEMAMYV